MNYNSVIGSDIQIYIRKTNTLVMSLQDQIPELEQKTVRDLLTTEELNKVESLKDKGHYPLIHICDVKDQDHFKGYFPLEAKLDSSMTIHKVDGVLDIQKVVTGG